MSDPKHTPAVEEAQLHGLLAEYDSPAALVHAAAKVRDAKFQRWDCYTPFPIHGLDPAMGIKPTVLPWIVLCAAAMGLCTAISLQYFTNAVDYPWIVSGKPFWSIPANVPIMFELTVLFSAITTVVAMLSLNDLPRYAHPLDLIKRFSRSTDDRFFILIEARDPKFDEEATRKLLEGTHPAAVEAVPEDVVTSNDLPKVLIYGLVVVTAASLVPFALAARARVSKSREPRIHAVPDMDSQPKFKAQADNPFFSDGRAMRPNVPGAVAVGQLNEDDHLHQGKVGGAFARTFPTAIAPTAENMARGEERFGIYCAPCHGLDGSGKGMVQVRMESLLQPTWVPPTNINQDNLKKMPVGELFNSITHGIRNMPGYGHVVGVEDRWRIVMYVRALQRSAAAKLDEIPAAERGALR